MDAKTKAKETEDDILANMIARLKHFDIRHNYYPETNAPFRRAAVLLPLAVQNGEILLLLTKRSKTLRTHPSTVALPGGLRENSDTSDIYTALREAEEEIGLPPSCVRILAVLTRGITLPNNVVYPVVGFIPSNFQPTINPQEVESTFYIPLKDFLSDKVKMSSFKIHGRDFPSLTLKYDTGKEIFVIYGFTMFQCVLLASIIYDQNAGEREKQLEAYFDHVCQKFTSNSVSKL